MNDQEEHRCVCIESDGDRFGLIFCPDYPKALTRVYLKDKCWAQGYVADIKCRLLPTGQLKLLKASKSCKEYKFIPGTFRTTIRVNVQQAHQKFLPFTHVGFNEEFGNVLLPAPFKVGNDLIVEVQYNDYFLEGIYWVATKYREDDDRELRPFNVDLTLPISTLFPRLRKVQVEERPPSQQSIEQQSNVSRLRKVQVEERPPSQQSNASNNTNASRQTERSNESNKNRVSKVVNNNCVLNFPYLNPNDLTPIAKVREDSYMLVLQLYDEYAVAIKYSQQHPNYQYAIISNTVLNYDEFVKQGAFLEVVSEQLQNQIGPFTCIARGVIPSEDIRIKSINLNAREQVIDSAWGQIVFDNATLRKLDSLRGQNFEVTVQHMKIDNSNRPLWIVVPGKIQLTKSAPQPVPQTSKNTSYLEF
ncbi:hypothetical protein M3Y97_01136700 [Aphelenchoides bicaudatus]|nr:hypothetical protein M3Y97_01136700 [Aphelenchoides bicaudatus]